MKHARSRLMLAILVCLMTAFCPTRPEALLNESRQADSRRILKGLSGVRVLVENLSTAAKDAGLTRQELQDDVVSRLRRAGVRVLTDTPKGALLYLNAVVVKASLVGYYGWAVDLDLKEPVRLERDPERSVLAATWSYPSYRFGAASKARLKGRVRQVAAEVVDAFCQDYLAANPRTASDSRARLRERSRFGCSPQRPPRTQRAQR